jgi:peptidoglycan/LPS O-acetylase OafA/YrhL
MKVNPLVAGLVTAVATVASVLVTRSITDVSYSQISPIWAAIVGFIAPVYAAATLRKNRSRVKSPALATAVISLLVVAVVVVTSLLGSQEDDYKLQMITQFAVLAACCMVLVPAAAKGE